MNQNDWGPFVLRVVTGLLFFLPGLDKLMGMLSGGHMIATMIGPALAWVLLLVELLAGAAVIAGFKIKIAVWPLAAVMLGAIYLVVLPSFGENPMAMINLLFHLLAVASLVSLFFTGPGKFAAE